MAVRVHQHPPRRAGLTAGHGWYDQDHLARDFRSLVGQAPSAYVARRPPAM